jgi:hypothetical protein
MHVWDPSKDSRINSSFAVTYCLFTREQLHDPTTSAIHASSMTTSLLGVAFRNVIECLLLACKPKQQLHVPTKMAILAILAVPVNKNMKHSALAASSCCASPTNQVHRPMSVQAFIQAQSPARGTSCTFMGTPTATNVASFAPPTPIAGLHDSCFDPIKPPSFTEFGHRAGQAWTRPDAAVLELAAAGRLDWDGG